MREYLVIPQTVKPTYFSNYQTIASPNNNTLLMYTQKQSSDVFCKKGVMKKLGKIQRKTPVLESLFNKVATRWLATLLKKKLLHTHFLLNFAKFFVTPFLQNTSGRLLQCSLLKNHVKIRVIRTASTTFSDAFFISF